MRNNYTEQVGTNKSDAGAGRVSFKEFGFGVAVCLAKIHNMIKGEER